MENAGREVASCKKYVGCTKNIAPAKIALFCVKAIMAVRFVAARHLANMVFDINVFIIAIPAV